MVALQEECFKVLILLNTQDIEISCIQNYKSVVYQFYWEVVMMD